MLKPDMHTLGYNTRFLVGRGKKADLKDFWPASLGKRVSFRFSEISGLNKNQLEE